jgi:hypothetical protein
MKSKYEEYQGHKADFEVAYRFYTMEKGGRKTLPGQYYRADFMYSEDKPEDGIYMIWHEFTDANGNVLPEDNNPVPISGKAKMWIAVPEMREKIHCKRIKIGTKYFIMEGSRKVGEGEVVNILDLHKNPMNEEEARVKRGKR